MEEEREKQKIKVRFASFAQKAERLQTKRNQRILFLLTLALVAAAILDALFDFLPEPISIALYVLATVGFVLICASA